MTRDTALPGTPASPLARALSLVRAGQPAGALDVLDGALRQRPDDPALLLAHAQCLAELGAFAQSAVSARQAVAAMPEQAAAHHALGFALEQLGELDDASNAFEDALRLDPALADAAARLAGLAARRGEWGTARSLAAKALAQDPTHAAAHFALVMADTAEGHAGPAARRARAIADDPAYQPQIRAIARSLQADALDRQDRPHEAFSAYRKANLAFRDIHRARFERPGVASGTALAGRLLAEFEALDGVQPNHASPTTRPHVFVLGFPRSGTTLIAEVLAGHPGARVADERDLLAESLRVFTGRPGGLKRLMRSPPDELAGWRDRYWARAAELGFADGMLIDKSPFLTLHLPVIAALFPAARIVFAVRDPRDVVFACYRRLFALNAFLYECLTLEGAAGLYGATMRLAAAYRARLPLNMIEMRNESLAADPAREIGRLCTFLDIPTAPAMLDFASRKVRRAAASPQSAALSAGPTAETGSQWRRYAAELGPVLGRLEAWVRHFGYEP
ncbi:MAG TPA: sulfotransferase [Rhizomicrobium sp.]|nr:sulfotransferase [Rhizomicrobium sp.]